MLDVLDRVDRQMLAILQREARISNAELAQRVNLSPTPCLRRLRKLEEQGWIEGYHARLNAKALGYAVSAMVFVKLDKNTRANGEAFEAALSNLPQVTECCVVAGGHDYVLRVITTSLPEYEQFLKQDLATIEQVADLESLIILSERQGKQALSL